MTAADKTCRYCGADESVRPLVIRLRKPPEPPVWVCVDFEACLADQERDAP